MPDNAPEQRRRVDPARDRSRNQGRWADQVWRAGPRTPGVVGSGGACHQPRRPTWLCRLCGTDWPCLTARTLLPLDHVADPVGLAVLLATMLQEAMVDLRGLNPDPGPDPAVLHARFLGWVRPRPRIAQHRRGLGWAVEERSPVERSTVDLWFDPSCPYTWTTSRWLLEVAKVRPVELRWHLMSLSVLNEGRDDDPEGDPEGYLWVPVRICAAVADRYGQQALARFYTALWTVGRDAGQDWLGDLHAALAAAGLPTDLADLGQTDEYDNAVRASHAEAIALVGEHVGTPIVAATGPDGRRVAFFGPVISRIPVGEEAGRLWDGTLLVAGVAGFHELKGPPHAPPQLDIPA